jgi:hypothetical protein
MNPTVREQLIERIRTHLRRNDFVYGYFPQIVMEERASEWWCLLWYCVRTLDSSIDSLSSVDLDPAHLLTDASTDDFQRALSLFLQETAAIVPRQLIDELYQSTKLEQSGFSLDCPQNAATYLALVDMKTVPLVRICLLINSVKGDPTLMNAFAMGLGRAIQLLDDLLDLEEDLVRGKLFLTLEELTLLDLTPADIQTNLDRVARLRGQWVMATTWPIWVAANQLSDNNFSLMARSWVESVWKLIADGKAIPLSRSIGNNNLYFAHYMGSTNLPYEMLSCTELLKYQFFHRLVTLSLKYYKVFELSRAKKFYEETDIDLGPLLTISEATLPNMKPPEGQEVGADSRQMVDLNEGFGLPTVQRELPRILSLARAEWQGEVFDQLCQGNLARALLKLIREPMSFWQVVQLEDLKRAREAITSAVSPQASSLSGLVELAFDCASLVVEHHHALQHDLWSWLDNSSG